MGFDGAIQALGMIFQVFLLDLILSGDNAVVIALACRSLPPHGSRPQLDYCRFLIGWPNETIFRPRRSRHENRIGN